ncbi:MAG: type II toxin-antitoxin system Phd/YefM family antitoxin [Candidatus Marinimicrobia bacterium]|nr:type II toxin-antitoxin system Phd/YefM family antitoxin [Candidatus Neomarinimicrobiota bacterium]
MRAVLFTDARNHLNKLIKETMDQREPILIIGTKGRKDSVLISKEEYDNLIENLHILNNPEWIESIRKGIKDLDSGNAEKLASGQAIDM